MWFFLFRITIFTLRFFTFFFLFIVLEKVLILIWLFFSMWKIIFPTICCCTICCTFLFPKMKETRQNFQHIYKELHIRSGHRLQAKQQERAGYVKQLWEECFVSLRVGSGSREVVFIYTEYKYRSCNVRAHMYGMSC